MRTMLLGAVLGAALTAGAGVEPAPALNWEVYGENPGTLSPPLDFQQLVITTPDSARIAAWFVGARDSLGMPLDGRHPGLLVLPREHKTMDRRLDLIAGMARRGFNVLAIDHRGRGASAPFAADSPALLRPEFLSDAVSGFWILWKRPEVDTLQVAVYGESMGAVLALAAAREMPQIRAVVAVSPFYNLERYGKRMKEMDPDRVASPAWKWDRHDEPDQVLDRYNGFVFFIGGERDDEIPPAVAEALHKKYPRPKELWIVPGAGHAPEAAPRKVLGGAFFDRIAASLRRELAKKPYREWPDR
jgi:pimeloyl-ACP methyl ester carboxylesterase